MFFRQFVHEEKSCLSYMIGCQTDSTVAVIEPQEDIGLYVETARRHGLSIDFAIDTHTQADHRSGAAALAQETGAQVLMHQAAPVTFDFKAVQESDEFKVGRRNFRVIATPGHTADGMSFYVDNWYVLTGDTLFVGDVGRVDLTLQPAKSSDLEANAGQLCDSIQKLLKLPDWTEIYPSHFGGSSCGKGLSAKMISTIGREKLKNKALKLDRQAFIEYVTTDMPEPPADYQTIKQANIAGVPHGKR